MSKTPSPSPRHWLGWAAAIAGASAVGLGAFGAHGLKPLLLELDGWETWKTASQYHLAHALGLLGMALAQRFDPANRRWSTVAQLWLVGLILFCGSLYGLALDGPRWLGPITPLGGLGFLAGWLLLPWAHRPTQRPSAD